MRQIHLEQIDSTNSFLKRLLEAEPVLEHLTVVSAFEQYQGRGQRGNSWEAQPGKNLTCSILLRPKYPTEISSFDLNIITSLTIRDLLLKYLPHKTIKVKWPNDIMIKDRKIAGILIENDFIGSTWDKAIVGIGLNVLQREFADYSPQATSIAIEGGKLSEDYETWHTELLGCLLEALAERLHRLYHNVRQLREEYHTHLFAYQDASQLYSLPNGESFRATLIGVEPNGLLILKREGKVEHFAFKEVKFEI